MTKYCHTERNVKKITMLTKEEGKRYFKQILLEEFGLNGQIALKKAKVAVVGAGGLGCPVLQYLASSGVGTIGIIDFDTVDVSNLHRQILYTAEDVGKKKAELAAQKIKEQNPFIETIVHDVLLDDANVEAVLKDYEIVIDGCDNFVTRYTVNDACVKLNKPLVYGSILGFEGQISVFNFKGSKNLRDIFPEPPNSEDVPSCSENGVLGTLPGVIGTMMAQEAIKLISEFQVSVNQLMIVNTLNWQVQKLNY